MEQKKVRLSLIFSLIVFAIGVAINSLANFFSGFGLPFVAVMVLFLLVLNFAINSAETRKRTIDMAVLTGVSLLFMTILYCSWEWAFEISKGLSDFVNVFSNIYSIFSLVFLVYGFFRMGAELSGKTYKCIEFVLGNYKPTHSEKTPKTKENKQPKEVMNGDLEQKPNKSTETQSTGTQKLDTVGENVENQTNSGVENKVEQSVDETEEVNSVLEEKSECLSSETTTQNETNLSSIEDTYQPVNFEENKDTNSTTTETKYY